MYCYSNGLKYDTDESEYIGGSLSGSLYKTKNGRFFHAGSYYGYNKITPMEKEEAFNWAVNNIPRKIVETKFEIAEA